MRIFVDREAIEKNKRLFCSGGPASEREPTWIVEDDHGFLHYGFEVVFLSGRGVTGQHGPKPLAVWIETAEPVKLLDVDGKQISIKPAAAGPS